MTDAQAKWNAVFFDAFRKAAAERKNDVDAHAAACEAVAVAAMAQVAAVLDDLRDRRWGPNDGKSTLRLLVNRLRRGEVPKDGGALFEELFAEESEDGEVA